MSWSDVYPIFEDSLLEEFELSATYAEKSRVSELFEIEQYFNPKPSNHVVSASLFWKAATESEADLPPLSREVLMEPSKFGIQSRFQSPWNHYFAPLLIGARDLASERPDVTFRVYLAKDLEFLMPHLTDVGCEVALMRHSSIRHNPGAMWRFLALEGDHLTTITDSDRAPDVVHDVERTELAASSGFGHWRVPYTWGNQETSEGRPSHYRPILACQFGSSASIPTRQLMESFVWHAEKDSLDDCLKLAGGEPMKIFGTKWPDYGFDEWFLMSAYYPRMVFNGVLTFVPWADRSLKHWYALDIEYCSWASAKSEILYHGISGNPVSSGASLEESL